MSDVLNAAGGSERLTARASTSEATGLVDRRRWTSFLTWAFFIAEMAGRDGFLPTAAHAGDDELARNAHGSDHASPAPDNLPNVDVSTASDGPEPGSNQQAASSAALPQVTLLNGDLTDAKLAAITDALAHSGVGAAGGGGALGYGAFGHLDDVASGQLPADGMHVGIGGLTDAGGQLVAFNQAGEVLDLGLNLDLSQTAHNLLGGVADALGHIPLVGTVLDDTVHAVAATTGSLLSTLQPALSIVGLHHDAPGSSFALGSNGQLDFGQAPAGVHELDNVTGGYTNYGIALNTSIGNIVHASSDMAVHADAISTSMLDNFSLDHQSGSALHMTSDALHLDQALLRLASDVLS